VCEWKILGGYIMVRTINKAADIHQNDRSQSEKSNVKSCSKTFAFVFGNSFVG